MAGECECVCECEGGGGREEFNMAACSTTASSMGGWEGEGTSSLLLPSLSSTGEVDSVSCSILWVGEWLLTRVLAALLLAGAGGAAAVLVVGLVGAGSEKVLSLLCCCSCEEEEEDGL